MEINNIVSTSIQTIEKLKEYKNGGNALFLYFDYIKHSRIQKTNQVWCNDSFMMKSTGYGAEKFRCAKNILKELGLIEVIQERLEDGKLGKFYIKINFLISEEKRKESIKPETGETRSPGKPETGETQLNALSNKIKMLEEENKMLKEKNKIISKEITKQEFGNKDINNLLKIIEEEVYKLGLIYKSGKQERNRAKNILTSKSFGETCNRSNMGRIDFVIEIIKLSGKLDFWKGKIYNAETFYAHYPKVYNEARRIKTEKENNKPKILAI